MILMVLAAPAFMLIDALTGIIPEPTFHFVLGTTFGQIFGFGITIIGVNNFALMMGSVMFWYTLQFTWAILEWLYKKIPGVN